MGVRVVDGHGSNLSTMCYYPARACAARGSAIAFSVGQWTKILKQLKCEVIRAEKGTITTFELFFNDHISDCPKH